MTLDIAVDLFLASLNSMSLVFGFVFGFFFWREVFASGGC